MKVRHLAGLSAASVFAFGMAVFAEQAQQAPAPNPAGAQQGGAARAATGAATEIIVSGCIQREADYRRARDAGRGGVAGTGVGAGNEFILASASTSSTSQGQPGAAGTSGATADYELTGSNEGQAEKYINQRVEITGVLKAADIEAGKPSGGPTAGRPPAGVDVAGQDLKLRELEIRTIKQASGNCPPAAK